MYGQQRSFGNFRQPATGGAFQRPPYQSPMTGGPFERPTTGGPFQRPMTGGAFQRPGTSPRPQPGGMYTMPGQVQRPPRLGSFGGGPQTGGDFAMAEPNSSPVQPNDAQMSGYGPGGGSPLGARSEGNVQDWITQRNSVEPHDYFSLGPFKPEEMAAGVALGQLPLGGMLGAIGGGIYNAFKAVQRCPRFRDEHAGGWPCGWVRSLALRNSLCAEQPGRDLLARG
jgi:hypothetical protein